MYVLMHITKYIPYSETCTIALGNIMKLKLVLIDLATYVALINQGVFIFILRSVP